MPGEVGQKSIPDTFDTQYPEPENFPPNQMNPEPASGTGAKRGGNLIRKRRNGGKR